MKIDYCILCYKFQRRLSWCLSSILEQIGNIPNIIINIGYVKNDGDPQTENVINVFKNKLHIIEKKYDSVDDILHRGNVRNDLLHISDSEWVFWADCDHIYQNNFFAELKDHLDKFSNIESTVLYSYNKNTTDIKSTDETLSESKILINDAFNLADKIPKIECRVNKKAGGAMQVIRREQLKGFYIKEDKSKANMMRFSSDIKFRWRFKNIIPLDLPYMIHLNHNRNRLKTEMVQN
jgi:hypothetical protein